MSLLSIAQNVCAELSLPYPVAVMGATEPTLFQLQRLVQREGDHLVRVHDWSFLRVQASFTCTGPGAGLPEPGQPPTDWERFAKRSSIWNNSRRHRLNGPVEADTWQNNVIYATNPVPQLWRMIGGDLAIYPNVAGEVISYEYVTGKWVKDVSGTTSRTFTADTDQALVSERILELGVIWRWKKAKGLDYGDFEKSYMESLENEIASDIAATVKNLSNPYKDGVPDNFWPGVISVS